MLVFPDGTSHRQRLPLVLLPKSLSGLFQFGSRSFVPIHRCAVGARTDQFPYAWIPVLRYHDLGAYQVRNLLLEEVSGLGSP